MNTKGMGIAQAIEVAGKHRKQLIQEVLAKGLFERDVNPKLLDISRMSRDKQTDGTETHFLDGKPIAEFKPFKIEEETGNIICEFREFEIE